jgi:beta-glucanase (GH16 family)
MAQPTVRATLTVVALACIAAGCGASDSDTAASAPPELVEASDAATDEPAVTAPEVLCTLAGAPAATTGDVLVFAEDFNGDTVDSDRWNALNGPQGHGTILNSSSPDKALVHDGSLFIVADRSPKDAPLPYVAGFLDTLGKFARTYGKFEFRARFPYVPGVWYAIWATPWSQPFPEIDIEITNLQAPQLWFVNHWAAPPLPADARRAYFVAPKDVKKPTDAVDLAQFHTYTLLWKPGLLELSVDGDVKMRRTDQGVPDLPLAWKINTWIGGWGGTPTAATAFPVSFEVDYVHVYRVDGLVADPSVRLMNRRSGSYAKTDIVQVAIADFDEACTHVEMYDGTTRLKTTSTQPFRFPLSGLKAGAHKLSFVATDGARSAVASVDAQID